jgi:hypothetical protein
MTQPSLVPGGTYGNIAIAQPQISPLGWYNQADLTPKNPIGGKVRYGNIVIRYVKIDVTVVPVAGAPLYALTFTPGGVPGTTVPVITLATDYDGTGATSSLQVQGVMGPFTITLPLVAFYTWVQVGGVAQCVGTGVTAQSNILIGSTTDNQFAVIADGSTVTNVPAARVVGACVAGQVPALLMNMDW